MSEFLLEYWRQLTFAALAVVLLFGEKLKIWVGGIKLPALSGLLARKSKDITIIQSKQDVEAKDIECISHLRDRAVECNDEVLLQEIKSVSNKFFDIHALPNDKH